ncbi:C-C motif chemokine 27a [Nelusetta ayraudi]|uniref:C-C motif chemokine 27a n=1 Tax=Nelusetta ayraudi TaxID=303726 RepID=UPI003F703D0A
MDLKAAVVVVCLCAVLITSTKAGIPKCCISTRKKIPTKLLLRLRTWDTQNSTGACDIHALVLYLKNRKSPVCAHPSMEGRVMDVWRRVRKNQMGSSI